MAMSDPKKEMEHYGIMTCYTKGGFANTLHSSEFQVDKNSRWFNKKYTEPMMKSMNDHRAGWFGWFGLGGSIFMWHPEHKLSFSYVPHDMLFMDFSNKRGSLIQ